MAYDEEKNRHVPIQIYLDHEAFTPAEVSSKRKTPTNSVNCLQKKAKTTPKANWNNYQVK